LIYINYLTSVSETLYPALIERVTLRAGEKFGSQGIKYLCQNVWLLNLELRKLTSNEDKGDLGYC